MTSIKDEQMKRHNRPIGGALLQIVISMGILAGAIFLANYLFNTSPKAKPKSQPPRQVAVETSPIVHTDGTITVSVLGNIIPAKETALKSQISGEIISMSQEMVPGGFVRKGQQLLAIDPTDYQIALIQLESDVEKASASLDLEMGSQIIARKEFTLLGEKANEQEQQLMLRKPQLSIAQASLKTAQARLSKAKLDLKRTEITAPFNGVIRSCLVNVGTMVNGSTTLGELVGTDTFWAELLIPVEHLKRIHLPDQDAGIEGSQVKISLADKMDTFKAGRVVRLAPDLEEFGRLAKIYVEIKDPLNLKPENKGKPPLFLGSYAHAQIVGKKLNNIILLKRKNLRNDNTIWLLEEGRLKIMPVEVVYGERENVFLKNTVPEGSKLIITNIDRAMDGMLLKDNTEKDVNTRAATTRNDKKK